MKRILPLVLFCCLVAACNRPMLQPPVSPTAPVRPGIDTRAALTETKPLPALKTTQTATAIQIAAISTKIPTNSPLPGLTPTLKLSSTPSPYPTPAWCPVEPVTPTTTGKLRVAYANQDNLWVWDEDESAHQLSKSGDIKQVSISDDGQIIAFTRQLDENHEELWAINVDGENERRLVSAEEFARLDGSTDSLGALPWGFQWEPRTHHLTFFIYPIYDGMWIFQPSIPWLVDVDTGEVSAALYHGGRIAYSPNGKLVVIFGTEGLSLVNIDGSNLRVNILSDYHSIGEGESYYHPQPYWAPDSASLLVALPDQDDIYSSNGTVTVWRVPVVGEPEKLGQLKAFVPSVQFSPDQTFMTYWLWPKPVKNLRELHFALLKGSTSGYGNDTIYLSGDMISDLVWSSDSQHFIFQMEDPDQPTRYFYTGDICHQPKQRSDGSYGGIATWVDASRFLLEIHDEIETDSWELRLGTLNLEQTELIGVVTNYDWAILP